MAILNYTTSIKAEKTIMEIQQRFVNDEQALKVSWRIVKNWVEAQMALVEAQLADVAEVVIPYAITKKGNTLYNEIGDSGLLMIDN